MASWTVPALTRVHAGAWPLALDLFEEGRLSGPATVAVRARLMELGQTTAMLSMAAQDAVTAGFVQQATVSRVSVAPAFASELALTRPSPRGAPLARLALTPALPASGRGRQWLARGDEGDRAVLLLEAAPSAMVASL